MDNKDKSCCFSGHRIEKLSCDIGWLEKALTHEIEQAISDGFDTFYHGGCTGVDLIAAEQVLLRRFVVKKDNPEHIKIIAVLPYEGQADRWSEHWRERYFNVLSKCNEVIPLHTAYTRGCYQERNRYMVDHSQRLISVYDGKALGGTKQTITYAQGKGLEIKTISI